MAFIDHSVDFFKEVINDHQTCIKWCTNVGLLTNNKLCPRCRMQKSIVGKTDSSSGLMFRCQKRNHVVRISLSKET